MSVVCLFSVCLHSLAELDILLYIYIKFLDKLPSISEIDDHLVTNPPCLKSNEEINDIMSNELGMFNNFIGKLKELCLAHAWNLPKYE